MTIYHKRCYECGCTMSYDEIDDGSDEEKYSSGYCGHEDNHDDDDWYDDDD